MSRRTFEIIYHLSPAAETSNSAFFYKQTLSEAIEQFELAYHNAQIKCVHEYDEKEKYIETHRFNISREDYWKEIDRITSSPSFAKKKTFSFFSMPNNTQEKLRGLLVLFLLLVAGTFVVYSLYQTGVEPTARQALADELGIHVQRVGPPSDQYSEKQDPDKINKIYNTDKFRKSEQHSFTYVIDGVDYDVVVLIVKLSNHEQWRILLDGDTISEITM